MIKPLAKMQSWAWSSPIANHVHLSCPNRSGLKKGWVPNDTNDAFKHYHKNLKCFSRSLFSHHNTINYHNIIWKRHAPLHFILYILFLNSFVSKPKWQGPNAHHVFDSWEYTRRTIRCYTNTELFIFFIALTICISKQEY